jgi:hypothetical protein
MVLGVASTSTLPRNVGDTLFPLGGTSSPDYFDSWANLANPVVSDWVISQMVPEPGTALLVVSGLVVFGFMVRKRGLGSSQDRNL